MFNPNLFFQPYNRIVIDVDSENFNEMIHKVVFGILFLRCDNFDVYVSGSGRGYHIIFHKKTIILLVLFYRLIIGDDLRRLKWDLMRVLSGCLIGFDAKWLKYRYVNRKIWKKAIKITPHVKWFIIYKICNFPFSVAKKRNLY